MTTMNPWFNFSTPGWGGGYAQQTQQPGVEQPGIPTMGAPQIPDLSRFAPPVPQDWRSSAMPTGGGMAGNQRPELMQQMANIMARGKMFNPMQTFAGMSMNPRYQGYAGMKPDGQIGKGGNPGMMGMGGFGAMGARPPGMGGMMGGMGSRPPGMGGGMPPGGACSGGGGQQAPASAMGSCCG